MIFVPLPFVVALLLVILAIVLIAQQRPVGLATYMFIGLCAAVPVIVGIRALTDIPLFRALQPAVASCVPVAAWYCFARAHHHKTAFLVHALWPLLVILGSLTYPFWNPPLDPLLAFIYLGYGVALIRVSFSADKVPGQVRLSQAGTAIVAERFAGVLLLLSAMLDIVISVDMATFQGVHADAILSIGHFILLPVLSGMVLLIGMSRVPSDRRGQVAQPAEQTAGSPIDDNPSSELSDDAAKAIIKAVTALMIEKEVFLDPDLTLDRLARKSGIPARQISVAINRVYNRNISQVVNEYRIERAKELLANTTHSITQVYLESGFQTKSNFNREFLRVTQLTPSAYRRSLKAS
ncbi:helix-turn-helix domain-containing protein [Saccharospirillum alexandrii]|uniref:helix-turn-helix domain-containing protein n=1 Tax=Saccharospirillum alexandrii TaxID=2448477 RepID=UPI000FDAC1F7|nr:AraC family transcriptional regulator [Saccharospirillum alexandrii]